MAMSILASLTEGVIAIDADGQVLLVNDAARQLLDIPPGPCTGQSIFELVRHPAFQELAREILKTPQAATREVSLGYGSQQYTVRARGMRCDSMSSASAILVLEDVTENQRYDQLRREFVANVSHELKSPLTSIRSAAETLLEGALQDPAHNRRFVQMIAQDSERLGRLIDDLLELSQIESQPRPLERSVFELAPLARQVADRLSASAAKAAVAMTVEVPAGLRVTADPDGVRQILLNLTDNAIKYNRPGGHVWIRAAARDGMIALTVADDGIGIPPQDTARIFERFYRVDKARSRELGGTGLGLSIVKHLAEAHGGRVSVESRLGEGTKFTVFLPV